MNDCNTEYAHGGRVKVILFSVCRINSWERKTDTNRTYVSVPYVRELHRRNWSTFRMAA